MTTEQDPTIADAKAIAVKYRKRRALVFWINPERGACGGASYGMTRLDCRQMGSVLDQIVALIEDGTIKT